MIKYIDVSFWQQDVKYKEVALNGIEGALIRCGYIASDRNHLLSVQLHFAKQLKMSNIMQ